MLPRIDITDYNVLIDDRNFYDQSFIINFYEQFNHQVKKYYEIRKSAAGQGDDCSTGCLLDYQYFKDHERLVAVDQIK